MTSQRTFPCRFPPGQAPGTTHTGLLGSSGCRGPPISANAATGGGWDCDVVTAQRTVAARLCPFLAFPAGGPRSTLHCRTAASKHNRLPRGPAFANGGNHRGGWDVTLSQLSGRSPLGSVPSTTPLPRTPSVQLARAVAPQNAGLPRAPAFGPDRQPGGGTVTLPQLSGRSPLGSVPYTIPPPKAPHHSLRMLGNAPHPFALTEPMITPRSTDQTSHAARIPVNADRTRTRHSNQRCIRESTWQTHLPPVSNTAQSTSSIT